MDRNGHAALKDTNFSTQVALKVSPRTRMCGSESDKIRQNVTLRSLKTTTWHLMPTKSVRSRGFHNKQGLLNKSCQLYPDSSGIGSKKSKGK